MRPPSLGIERVECEGRTVAVADRVARETAFCILRRFEKADAPPQPQVLVVAPMSGHFGWLMRDCVAGLLGRHRVALLEWKDAADIPAAAGRFGLDRVIASIIDAMRTLGPGYTVLGVSQAPVPILAATAVMAGRGDPARPCALVLMGGFVDPRCRPTAVGRMTAKLPPGWFSHVLARPSAGGRAVYPGRYHWLALARYLRRHMATGGELSAKLMADDGLDPDRFPFLRLYSTLMDLPAEFAEDNATEVFREASLARGRLRWRGQAVDTVAIDDVALMTVEGGRDDSSGFGQTLLAHALCPRIPDALREHVIADDAGHFGLFHGRIWRDEILPQIEDFTARTAHQCPVRVERWRHQTPFR